MGVEQIWDVIVVGSGIAGLTTALQARTYGLSVLIVTKSKVDEGSTKWAQGGIAAALGPGDTPDQHLKDTLVAGADLCDVEAVRVLVTEGPAAVRKLIERGAIFDTEETGEISLTREGGHLRNRILHAGGDATGAEVSRALLAAVHDDPEIEVVEDALVLDAIKNVSGAVCGVTLHVIGAGSRDGVGRGIAKAVVLATGGLGQVFASTTNPGTYGLKLMNSNGTQHSIVHDTGDITALGNGAIFYIGSGFFGNVITTAQGYNYGASAQFTNMDTSVTAADITNYTWASTTPLTAGQTAAPAGPPPPVPTAIYNNSSGVYITRAIPTSTNSPGNEGPANAFDNNPYTKYLNFDKQNAGVTVQLNAGRVVTSFKLTTANDAVERDPASYKLYGSNDGSTWTLIQQGSLSLSNDRFSVSNEITITNSIAYVYYFMIFPTIKDNSGNSVQIAEITYFYDANNTTTSTATSSTIVDPTTAAANTLCCGGSAAPFNSSVTNIAKVQTFTNRTTADSKVNIEQLGTQNEVTVNQSGTQNNFVNYYGNGLSNSVEITQQGNATTQVNYTDLRVVGNFNTVSIEQTSTGGCLLYTSPSPRDRQKSRMPSSA